MAAEASSSFVLPGGVFPTMVTPFLQEPDDASRDRRSAGTSVTDNTKALGVDYEALDKLCDWYLASGCVGLFSPCQSSEMFDLTPEERLAVATAVKKRAGDKPVVACGTFGGPIAEQAAFVNEMAKVVDAVVVIVCELAAKEEGDDVWRSNCEELMRLTAGVPLGLYECPAPYHRLLPADTLKWLAGTGRFFFHKDTSRTTPVIGDKLDAIKTVDGSPFKFYNGNVATLLPSLQAGGHGFSGVSCNFYPWLHVWLVNNWEPKPEQAAKVQRFLAVAENTVKAKYPASAKVYLALNYGVAITPATRTGAGTPSFLEEETIKLRHLHDAMADLCKEIGIEPVKCG